MPQVTQRSIYYHLKRGLITKEVIMNEIEQEKGDYSWGTIVEKKYYTLGSKARPQGDKRIKEFLEKFRR